jgi:hypothetical protein
MAILFIVIGGALAYGGRRAESAGLRWNSRPVKSTRFGNMMCLIGGSAFVILGAVLETLQLVGGGR